MKKVQKVILKCACDKIVRYGKCTGCGKRTKIDGLYAWDYGNKKFGLLCKTCYKFEEDKKLRWKFMEGV